MNRNLYLVKNLFCRVGLSLSSTANSGSFLCNSNRANTENGNYHKHDRNRIRYRFLYSADLYEIQKFEFSSFGRNPLNPFNLFDIWHELDRLKSEWDPNFNLSDFKHGVKQAFVTTVSLINEESWKELRGLLILPLLEKLQNDENFLYTVQKISRIAASDIDNMQIARVALQEIVEHKYCDIDVKFKIRGQEFNDEKSSLAKDNVYLVFILRFHREYTTGILPQWTITNIFADED